MRALVKLIDKQQRKPIYTDFEDLMGNETRPDGFERFRAKARAFLREREDHLTIHKLRMNRPLTSSDLDEWERMLTVSGLGAPEQVQRAKAESQGLGLFVCSLSG